MINSWWSLLQYVLWDPSSPFTSIDFHLTDWENTTMFEGCASIPLLCPSRQKTKAFLIAWRQLGETIPPNSKYSLIRKHYPTFSQAIIQHHEKYTFICQEILYYTEQISVTVDILWKTTYTMVSTKSFSSFILSWSFLFIFWGRLLIKRLKVYFLSHLHFAILLVVSLYVTLVSFIRH